MTQDRLPAPSIILEWETVLEGGLERVQNGLRQIGNQIAELASELEGPPELIICHDPEVISSADLMDLLRQSVGELSVEDLGLRLCPVPSDCDYYEKKNLGAARSSKDILLFFDTDLVPDPGWLRGMLMPFLEWKVAVVVGATHLDHVRTYDLAVALFWIFPPALPEAPLRPTKRLVSNNIAFRRSVFARFPFPKRPTHRGQCTELGLLLMNAGITMYEQAGARASHPPPPGWLGFLKRAWAAGQDEHYYASLDRRASVRDNGRQLLTDFGNVSRRIAARKLVLRAGALGQVAGWVLGVTYYTIKATGYLVALIRSATPSSRNLRSINS